MMGLAVVDHYRSASNYADGKSCFVGRVADACALFTPQRTATTTVRYVVTEEYYVYAQRSAE